MCLPPPASGWVRAGWSGHPTQLGLCCVPGDIVKDAGAPPHASSQPIAKSFYIKSSIFHFPRANRPADVNSLGALEPPTLPLLCPALPALLRVSARECFSDAGTPLGSGVAPKDLSALQSSPPPPSPARCGAHLCPGRNTQVSQGSSNRPGAGEGAR